MAERPSQYMTRYKPISFNGCDSQGKKYININTYISGDVMSDSAGFAKKAYLDLYRFIHWEGRYADGANGADKHYYFTDSEFLHAAALKPIPFQYCPWSDVRAAFQGKGTPTRMARALTLCDYYLKYANIKLSDVGWGRRVTALQEYANYYIGLDCNGFVGAYLQENFPESGIVANIDIDSTGLYFSTNATGTHFNRIDDPKSIKRFDILVRRKVASDPDKQTRHIALVDDVVGVATGSSVKLSLTESTGGSGLHTRTATLNKISHNDRGRHWKLGDREYDAVIRCK